MPAVPLSILQSSFDPQSISPSEKAGTRPSGAATVGLHQPFPPDLPLRHSAPSLPFDPFYSLRWAEPLSMSPSIVVRSIYSYTAFQTTPVKSGSPISRSHPATPQLVYAVLDHCLACSGEAVWHDGMVTCRSFASLILLRTIFTLTPCST